MKILINEKQLNNIIKEAIPYSIAKPYITTQRTDYAIKLMGNVFSKLKTLPNAKVLDKRGDRIAFPYGETPLEDEIKMLLRKYDYNVLNFNNNEALRIAKTEQGDKVQPIKITKALTNISRVKDKDGNIIEPNAKNLADLFADAIDRKMSKKLGLIVIFARHPYDIAGMSYGRTWRSCMHLTDGQLRDFVKKDIENGTIAVYLTKATDEGLTNPLARVLVKPYVNVANENDVILYPEAKTYGKIDNPKKFIDYLDSVLEKVQNISAEYKLLTCLNPDSKREVIVPKNHLTRKNILAKIENGDKLKNAELNFLTQEEAEKYVAKQISMYYKWNARLSGNDLDDLALTEEEILIATDDQLDEYFEQRLDDFEGVMMNKVLYERYVAIDDFELRFMSSKQMNRYVDILHAAEANRRSYTL
jgi:hypothetical protein